MEQMLALIGAHNMLPPGATVLCAVSGGADSICLLHRLYLLRPQMGFSLACAHYNHQLRGAESDRDAQFVAQFISLCCAQQRLADGRILPPVPLFSGIGDVATEAACRSAGIEETARSMRYAFLEQTARQIGAERIATGHTADDNAETILFHLARGSGLRGLGGIPPVRGAIIRPLLTTTRQEVMAHLQKHTLPNIEDSSNASVRYTRNRIRHQVIPVLEDSSPGFAPRMAELAARLRSDEAFLWDQAASIAAQSVARGADISIAAAAVGEQADPIARRIVQWLLERVGGAGYPCTALHIEGVVALCRNSDPSARLSLPRGLTALRAYNELIVARLSENTPPPPAPLPSSGTLHWGGWVITVTAVPYAGQPHTPYHFYLSQRAALTVRSRQAGDCLALPGRPRKSLKKWLIEEKIPRLCRTNLPVLIQDGQIAAVAALGPDPAHLPNDTQGAWCLTLTPPPSAGLPNDKGDHPL